MLSKYQGWLHQLDHLSPNTKTIYLRQINNLLAYLIAFDILRLNDISQKRLYQFIHQYQQKTYSKTWVRVKVASLQLFFRWAYENKYCREQPMVTYKKNKIAHVPLTAGEDEQPDERIILTNKEQQRLTRYLATVDKEDVLAIRNRCIILLILATGLFAAELVALFTDDLSLKSGYIIVRNNTNRIRKINVDINLCRNSCKEWLSKRNELLGNDKQPFLFITQHLQPISLRSLYNIVADTLLHAGIIKKRAGAEVLRQTAIFNRLKNGASLETIRQEYGINTLAQIERYSDIDI